MKSKNEKEKEWGRMHLLNMGLEILSLSISNTLLVNFTSNLNINEITVAALP